MPVAAADYPVNPTAESLIARLGLEPHPEGGAFRETYRAVTQVEGRALATAIYFLLSGDQYSTWHRVAHDEIWLYHGGDTLCLRRIDDQGCLHQEWLGLSGPALPQRVVPAGQWQSALGTGGEMGWTLVGCVVAPGFDFRDFEMATVAALSQLYPELAPGLAFAH